ncbi:MAG: OPT family oligopeptide transporter [Acidobacteriota bacterium]
MSQGYQPYVSPTERMAELTFRAVVLGAAMAILLGAANAYLGMKAGLTVAATFPAAVVAMAFLRLLGGTILEENVARTTASVGEALVAGAIFTLPAFIITGAWDSLRYWPSTVIMMIGGILGVLFVIVLRRTLVVESDLAFPESIAAAELVKAGQGGQTGVSYLLGAMGLAGLWELFKNQKGPQIIKESVEHFVGFGRSTIEVLERRIDYSGGLLLQSPSASPILMGVGFIVGMRISAVLFSGALMGWLFLVPLALFLNPSIADVMGSGDSMVDLAESIWERQIRPLAVGTMIVAAFYTLYRLRGSLVAGIGKAFREFGIKASGAEAAERTEIDIDPRKIFITIALFTIPMFILYHSFSGSVAGSLVLTLVMVVLGFLFAAVAGYLVGLIGSSNNPISGLTLSALLISAVLMVWMGVTGAGGVAAVLAVAGVVCCAAGIAGDMMQDLKVGHMLGGTPWRMEIGEIIGVICAAAVLALPLQALHRAYTIGSPILPAPQAGLMALLAQGIVGGDMAWPLVIVGMFLALGLILIGAPSPMLIAVGMYLPFSSTAAIFVGGIFRRLLDLLLERRRATDEEKTRATNVGILLSSGFIAGESLMAVLLAFVVLFGDVVLKAGEGGRLIPAILDPPNPWAGLVIFAVVLYLLVGLPLRAMKKGTLPSTHVE